MSAQPIGYLNVAHSTYFRAADFVLNDGTRALLASGEIVALYAGAAPAASALLKLCDQLDAMKLRRRDIPGEGQRESYYVADDVNCYVEEARAVLAAPVGADVAADRQRSPYVLGVKPSDWAEQIAAGAPAETVKQEPVAWMVFAGDYGVLNPQFPARALRADAERDALLYGQTPTEVRPLHDYAAPSSSAEARDATTFSPGDIVRKKSGSQWEGTIVGTYSSSITPEGYAVESSTHRGSVQIYPVSALERVN